jgi:galactokinase
MDSAGYSLCITDTKGSHADLTPDYAAVPAEMKSVAACFGKEVLRELKEEDILSHASYIREKCGDRAFLRAFHFVDETERALDEAEALKAKDIDSFLDLVRESGQSSWMYLQNISVPGAKGSQPVALALALSDALLTTDGAFRVHGGGFAGTIQAFVPKSKTAEYIKLMEAAFGEKSCYILRIRDCGGIEIK